MIISHRICADLNIDSEDGWGQLPPWPPFAPPPVVTPLVACSNTVISAV